MARIEWIKQRLSNWALWKARQQGGGLGFSSQASFLNEVDSSRYRESVIPIDETEASVTNDGVEALKATRPTVYECVMAFYVFSPGGDKATALYLGRARSTVHASLDQADIALAAWFIERSAKQKERLAAYSGHK